MMDRSDPFAPIDMYAAIDEPKSQTAETFEPIQPVPDDAPELTSSILNRFTPAGFVLVGHWLYHDANGRLLGCTARFDKPANGAPAEKQVRPFTFCSGPGGRTEWRCKGFAEPRPLYGLDQLAARPDTPVLIVEGEKSADAAAKRFPDHVIITSPGGSKAARKADWSPVAGRQVIIWPDADDAGTRYTDDVADMARSVRAASVDVVKLPSSLPKGWDLADDLPNGLDDADIAAMLTDAVPAAPDGPIPLFPPMPAAEPFPIEALGPVLSSAAAAIARKVQVPEAIAAQSVLAAASLAAQAHADVVLPFGQTRPLSLFFVTVAGSGERKSTADNEALWPIRKREKALKEEYDEAYQDWSIATAAYNAEKKKVENNKNLDFHARKEELSKLGPEPEKPLYPFLTAPDPTIEGLVKAWVTASAALGIFTAEGGQFIGGYGMSQDNRLKSAAAFSEIWDGQPIKRIRSLDGVSVLHGRRLSMHLMVQPQAAALFLSDDHLRDQGLLSRVLVAAPESIAGTRFYREVSPKDDVAIRSYGARILSMLEAPWSLAEGQRNELEPRPLLLSTDAQRVWRDFYNNIEDQCGSKGDLRPIQDFAAKAAEHAARIAGVLTIVDNVHATEIGINAMSCALLLADWYVNEAVRLQQAGRTDPKLLAAQQLLDWMQGLEVEEINFREILQCGPSGLRTKRAAEQALKTLIDHAWVQDLPTRPRKLRLVREA